MKTQINLLAAYQRARRAAWAKLNGGNSQAMRAFSDPVHAQFDAIMARLRAGMLRAIARRYPKIKFRPILKGGPR